MSAYSTYSDEQLLQLLKQADEAAFTAIYRRYREQLLNYALQIVTDEMDAIEVVHDVLLAIWRRHHTLDILHLDNYLFRSTRYGALKKLAGNTKVISLSVIPEKKLEQLSAADNTDADIFLNQEEITIQIEKAVEEMPDRMRTVYELRRSTSLSHREIGLRLNITEETSKKHFKNALNYLRTQLAHIITVIAVIADWIYVVFLG